MKITRPGFSLVRGTLGVVALTISILSVAFLGGVSVQGQVTNFNWISTSSSDDYSVAADWDQGYVPGGVTNDVLLFTNGVSCNYNSPDTNVVGQLQFAPWDNSSGSFVMNSGTLTVSNSIGVYPVILGGGQIPNKATLTGTTGIGSSGSITMNGGTLNVERITGNLNQDGFIMGLSTNSSGTFTMNNGTLTIICGLEMGVYGSSIFNLNGGTVIDNGWFGLAYGNSGPFGSAIFNMTGGSLYVLRNSATDGASGSQGAFHLLKVGTNAQVNASGGSLYCRGIGFAISTTTASSVAKLNISGGTFYLGYAGVYSNGPSVESVNISGGTFHTLDMLANAQGITNAGIISSNILSDGTNWTWTVNPKVNLTNSSFLVNGTTGPGYVTFAPEPGRTITLNNQWNGTGGLVINGPGTIALGGANIYTGGTTISQGNLTFNTGGSVVDNALAFPSGSTLTFNTTGTTTFTNIVTGPANIVFANTGVVNVGNNLQNTGTITQNNGVLVVNGTILNASSITNNSPATVGPLVAQGIITPPIGIGANSAIETGTTVVPGTLNASNVTINGTWDLKINTATTPGGGTNDLLICSNLTLGANSILNVLPLSLPAGSYVIAEYSGTLVTNVASGFGTVTDPTRTGSYTVSFATPGEVILNISAVTPASLTWATPLLGGSNQWDVGITTNWVNAGVLDKFHQQDAVTFSATPSPALTNRVVVTAQMLPSSITIGGGLPYIFSGTGHISGGTGITYNDTNTSGIFTFGNDFTGPVNINAGVLQLGSGGSSWLGATNGPTVVNGGTLDLNGQAVGAEPLILQGSGGGLAGTNGGAINDSATSVFNQSGGPLNITLSGDATFNATGARWDIGINSLGAGGGSFTGNGHNLTKIGNQAIWMHEVGDIGVGNIDIQQGLLGFSETIGMGIAGANVTVEPGAILGLFGLSTNSLLKKQLVLNGNATLQSGGNPGASNNFIGPITLVGTNSIQTSIFPLNLQGTIGGTGGFTLSGTGPLILGGVDSYSGSTLMAAGSHIVIGPGASIANTPLIYMTPSQTTFLDATTNTFTLGSGQTLVGGGQVIATNFVVGSGATVSPGTNFNIGGLIFTNNLTLNGGTNNFKIQDANIPPLANDIYTVNGNLTLSGVSTINVTPLTGLLPQPYVIMQVNGSITGSAANLNVVSLSPRYTMSVTFNNPPFVEVVPTGIPASLVWKGNLSSIWSYGTSNWFNLGTGQGDTFFIGDNPIFDDSTAVNTVTITNGILPSGIFMSNVVKSYTFNGAAVAGGTLNMEGNGSGQGGSLVLAMTNAPAFTAIDSSAGTLVYALSGVTNYTVVAPITDNLGAGQGAVIFGGTNTAVLEGNNAYDSSGDHPAFYGTFWVTNGVLQYTNINALGVDAAIRDDPAFSPLIITNNGTLDFNGVVVSTNANSAPIGSLKWIHISGTGFNGAGALTDSKGNQEPNGAFCNLYLDGDATINIPSVRCDQHVLTTSPGPQVMGNGFNLTFKGGGALFFNAQSDGDTHFGNIDVASTNGGRLAFQGAVALGLTDHYLFVETNATISFFSVSNGLDPVHAGIDKIMWMKGSAILDNGGNSNNYIGPVFLTGTNLFGSRSNLHLWNTIMDTNGPGGFVLGNDAVGASGGDLWLDGTNSYSGPTIISNRTVHVGVNSSLGLSTYVQVSSGATLDLSAMPVFNFGTVATNQVMAGNGTIIGPATGNINFNTGSTLAPGLLTTNGVANTNTFTLTISNSIVFNPGSVYVVGVNKRSSAAATNASDKVVGLTSVTMGGTLAITNYGINYVGGDAIQLFSATACVPNGFTSNNIVPPVPGPNLAWDTSTLGTDGTLRIFSTLTVNPQPTNIVFSVSGGQLTLSWPADHTGWELQVQTNGLAVGISTNWTPIPSSTTVNSVIIPINLTNGSVFYRMVYPPQ